MFNWKLERFPQLMVGWWARQRKNDVTWVLHRKNKIHYLCKSKDRPERLIKFMCLVPDFYIFGWRGYTYCYWTSEPDKETYFEGPTVDLGREVAELRKTALKTIFKS